MSAETDRRYFSPVLALDRYVQIHSMAHFCDMEREYGREIVRLEHLKDALEKYLYQAFENGAIAVKTGLAYYRNIHFDKVTFSEAERSFNTMRSAANGYHLGRCHSDPVLENYMMHYALSLIQEIKLPLQVHTGQLGGNEGMLSDSNPELLNPLFMEYPGIRFDIFHIGYPYQSVLGGLVKIFPNV